MRASTKVAAAVLLLGSVASAEEPFAWNPAERAAPKKGMRFVEELDKTDARAERFTNEDGKSEDDSFEAEEKIRLLHEVAAVSSGVSEDRIRVEKWTRGRKGVAPDTSLEGTVVTIKGEGPFRTYTVDSDHAITPPAKAWINTDLVKGGKGEPSLDELDWPFILPRDRVAGGGEWTLDPVAVAREVLGPRAQIDAARSRATGKLAGVKVENGVHFGHVEVAVDLALETLGPSKVTWTEGGLMQIRYVLDLSLEPSKRDLASGTITIALKGKGTVEPPGAPPLKLELDQSSKVLVRREPIE